MNPTVTGGFCSHKANNAASIPCYDTESAQKKVGNLADRIFWIWSWIYTVRCCSEILTIYTPWGRDKECLLWFWYLIHFLPLFSQCSMWYPDKLDRGIMALDCSWARRNINTLCPDMGISIIFIMGILILVRHLYWDSPLVRYLQFSWQTISIVSNGNRPNMIYTTWSWPNSTKRGDS